MTINESKITVKALAKGYTDKGEGGVIANDGYLDVRPPYQREFVYDDEKRANVIKTVLKGYPLNVFYWGEDDYGHYELIDGQQRTISICQFVTNQFGVEFESGKDSFKFCNLSIDEQNAILDYEITIFICNGTDEEKLAWFETINIAGEKLTKQELRNAVYTGAWLSSAKNYFSRNNCPAKELASGYLSGNPIRQEYLEEVLKWASDKEDFKTIEGYMASHKGDTNADDLWGYFKDVISWVREVFGTEIEKDMKGIHWGILYNKYKDNVSVINRAELDKKLDDLRNDEEVTKKSGIYAYILSGDEKYLNIRKFPDKIIRTVYKQQGGKCAHCGNVFDLNQMEADHKRPWSSGGKTDLGNCQLLCVPCNRKKGNKYNI